jgi:two-component system response regulator
MNVASVENKHRWMLVIEDNPDDERLATRTFSAAQRSEDYQVARDGEEALVMLKREDKPALVLLDLKLPRLSGVEVLMAIRDDPRLKTVPVVVLTSSDEKSDRSACYELGCNAFVRKPIDYDEYRRQLTATLDFWLNVNLTA